MAENNDKYLGLKRFVALIASVGLWAVSMYFSYKGFEFDSTTVLWFGTVLALVVTVVELVFNTKISKLNPTLLLAGIMAYVYGVYTNITGFYVLQHGNLDGFFTGKNWLIPIFAGVITEVLPEALFAWSIGAHTEGDLVGNIGDLFTSGTNPVKKSFHENTQGAKSQPESRPMNPAVMQRISPKAGGQHPPSGQPERGGEPEYHPIGGGSNGSRGH
jgi:hypothetical protein